MLKFRQNLIHLFLKFRSFHLKGQDGYGNRYYERLDLRKSWKKSRRIVIYKGQIEASKVPAEWYGWLHHTVKAPLKVLKYEWQQPHLPNLTGTIFAYRPQNLKRQKYYEAWEPNNKE